MDMEDLIIPIDKFTETYLAPAAKGLAEKVKRGEKLTAFENELMESAFGLPYDPDRHFIALPPTE